MIHQSVWDCVREQVQPAFPVYAHRQAAAIPAYVPHAVADEQAVCALLVCAQASERDALEKAQHDDVRNDGGADGGRVHDDDLERGACRVPGCDALDDGARACGVLDDDAQAYAASDDGARGCGSDDGVRACDSLPAPAYGALFVRA